MTSRDIRVRSYILHPCQLVKDHRTGVQATDTRSVLDGEIDQFILAEIRWIAAGRKHEC